ncbi:MAG: FtsX-like permease family protein [Nocardioidaceae bacterium]
MRTTRWLTGLIRRRPLELLVAAVSIALTVAFVASLGAFVAQSHAALTVRAARSVPVDWQVQVTPQGNVTNVANDVRRLSDVRAVEQVSYAHVRSLQSTGAQGARSTGAAYVVSVSPAYATAFPGELRHLLGKTTGSMLFQQTAANLAVEPGGGVSVRSASGLRSVTVDGIVDMPAEDSFFQVVGLAPGAGVSAPPDNVLLVSPTVFRSVIGSTTVVHQLHVGFTHGGLPADPQTAAIAVQGRANHFQAAVAGGALVGDNLGTALTLAGEDARYANLLFLLLGLPGLALAAVVAGLVVALRSDRRRREIALLRLRGASIPQVVRMVAAESVVIAAVGAVLGVPLAMLAIRLALPSGTALAFGWAMAAIVGGLVLALTTQAGPVLQRALGRDRTGVAAEVSRGARTGTPWPLKAGLDVIFLAGATLSFALTARSGYQVVLAPEGIPQTQVNYAALAGPALAWPGLALLVWRITSWVTSRRTGRWARGGPGRAPELEAAALRQRRRVIARGAAGLAVAVGLAVSTAIFTYDAQSRLDVALTVGSDVAVVEPSGSSVGPRAADGLAKATGVRAVEPLQHRFGYVGPDLQDLYGVQASSFARVAPLQDAFVPGSTIHQTLAALQRTPDGVLLSAETLHDYQLHPGDLIRIRLQTGSDHAYRPVDFHVLGQVTEWPTAPKDSFIVANADYLTQQTGSHAVGTFLVSTRTPGATATALRSQLSGTGTGARVQDTSSAGSQVTSASGLAGTDLSGLSRLELGFGVLLALACSGLALLGGIVERRRALVLLAALGATPRQRGRFLASEARAMVVAGVLGGAVVGTTIAYLLVKVLTGIFDPAPAAATVPWGYLAFLLAVVAGTTVLVVSVVGRLVAHAGPSELRDL